MKDKIVLWVYDTWGGWFYILLGFLLFLIFWTIALITGDTWIAWIGNVLQWTVYIAKWTYFTNYRLDLIKEKNQETGE